MGAAITKATTAATINNDNNNNMHNPESVQEHKLLRYFEIQTAHQISVRRPDLIIINNKKDNLQNCGLCFPGAPQSEIKRLWKEG